MNSISIQEAYERLCQFKEEKLCLDSLADFIKDNKLDYYFYFEGYVADLTSLDSTLQESSIDGRSLKFHSGYLKPFESVRHLITSSTDKLTTSIALMDDKPIVLFTKDLNKDINLSEAQNEKSFEIASIYESLSQTNLIQEKLLIKCENFNEAIKVEFNESKKTIQSLQNQLIEKTKLIQELQNKIEKQSLDTIEYLSPEEEIPHSKTRNRVTHLIHVLCDMNKLPINHPLVCFKALKAHADLNGLSCPEKDFTSKWLKTIHSI